MWVEENEETKDIKFCRFLYSRGYKKHALSGKFYWTLNERKTYFEKSFFVFFIDYDISIYVFDVRTLKQPNN
jgi:hypothetical protein